jgi:hypothetical protein
MPTERQRKPSYVHETIFITVITEFLWLNILCKQARRQNKQIFKSTNLKSYDLTYDVEQDWKWRAL